MKAKKPPQRHKKSRKLSSVPDVGITDHERAQIEEARRRAEVEDESVFEDDV